MLPSPLVITTHTKFKNFKNKEKVPFAIYGDLECLLEKNTDLNSSSKSIKYQKHIPFTIAYYLKCSYDDSLSKFELYSGKDCISWFINNYMKLL